MKIRKCANCFRQLTGRNSQTRTCSSKCRQAVHRRGVQNCDMGIRVPVTWPQVQPRAAGGHYWVSHGSALGRYCKCCWTQWEPCTPGHGRSGGIRGNPIRSKPDSNSF